MDNSTIQLIIQGGAVGIALALVWVIFKLVTNHDKHFLEALNRNTDAWNKNEIALTKLIDVIDILEEKIK